VISPIGPIHPRVEKNLPLAHLHVWAQAEMTETRDRLESMKTTLDNDWDGHIETR